MRIAVVSHCWTHAHESSLRFFSCLFSGKTDNSTLDLLVAEEADLYNDMIVFDFIDTYKNLTLKFVNAIRWIKNDCHMPTIQAVVKVDDDVWVNMPMLQRLVAAGVSLFLVLQVVFRAIVDTFIHFVI